METCTCTELVLCELCRRAMYFALVGPVMARVASGCDPRDVIAQMTEDERLRQQLLLAVAPGS